MKRKVVDDHDCGAVKLNGDGLCSIPAGKMTTHPGEGRCNLHSGIVEGVPVVGYDIPAIKERMQVFLHDPDIISVDNEIALLRSYLELLSNYIEIFKYDQDNNVLPQDSRINVTDLTTMINQCTRNISHLVLAKHQIEMDRKYMVDIRMVHAIFSIVGEAIDRRIDDVIVRSAIMNDLNRIALPAPITK